jgi:hypothetical protein
MGRLEHAVNNLKPQIACCKIDRAGRYEAIVPISWSRKSADLATTEEPGGTGPRSRWRRRRRNRIGMDKIGGEPLFRFTWDANGPQWNGSAVPSQVPHPHGPDPQETEPSHKPPPVSAEELAHIATGIEGLALAHSQRPLQQRIVARSSPSSEPSPGRRAISRASPRTSSPSASTPETPLGSTWLS